MKIRFNGHRLLVLAVALAILVGLGSNAVEALTDQDEMNAGPRNTPWCDTYESFARNHGEMLLSRDGDCPTQGDCDIAAVRDANIPDGTSPLVTIRLKFNVFREDDGTNAAATQAQVDNQAATMNTVYAPFRIQFVYETEFIDDTEHRYITAGDPTDTEIPAMKNEYADDPATQCNIYVTGWDRSRGTFPWDPDALGNLGGVVMDEDHFDIGEDVLAHEIGHNFGLWHTHHGVSEAPDSPHEFNCDWGCYEHAGSNSDETGDYCSDTPPTPLSHSCADHPGDDPCTSDEPWGDTWPENYMSYGGPGCWAEFSDQQMGRMRCWVDAVLTGWVPNSPPVAECIDVVVEADENCEAEASIDNGSYDPDGDPITLAQDPPGPYPLGETFCTLTVTDDKGLSDVCEGTVTVEDVTPPEPVCPADIEQANDPDQCSAVVEFEIDAKDNCESEVGVTVAADPPSGSVFPVGITPVTVTATDGSGNVDDCTFEVTVVDTQKPVVTCPQEITVEFITPSEATVEYQATATDNCDADPMVWCDPPSGSTFPIGLSTVTCYAQDDAGNVASCEFSFHLAHFDIKPLSCPNPLNIKPYREDEAMAKTAGMGPVDGLEGERPPEGLLPVAILGSMDFDVRDINPASLQINGIDWERLEYEDVAGPADDVDDYCGCATDGPDRFTDLTMKFKTTLIVPTLGPVENGDVVQILITGLLNDGTPLFGGDCVVIRGPKRDERAADPMPDAPYTGLVGANPNPFNPITALSFSLSRSADYSISIFNTAGREVEKFTGTGHPGLNHVTWNASSYASGVYFYRLTALGHVDTKKMVLVK